jgi:hypothetical protein
MAQRIKPSWAFERDVENDVVNSSLPGPLTVSPSLNSGDYLSRAPPPSAADSSKALRDGVAKIVTNTHATDPILGSVHSSNDSPSTISPSRFRLLVDVLENLRLGGNFLPLRSVVGAQLLLRNKLVYQEAGVTGFTQYITSAERAGIVAVGGTGGKAWVSLHPAGLTPLNHEMSSGKLNNS